MNIIINSLRDTADRFKRRVASRSWIKPRNFWYRNQRLHKSEIKTDLFERGWRQRIFDAEHNSSLHYSWNRGKLNYWSSKNPDDRRT